MRRPRTCAAETAVVRAVAEGTVEEIRQTATNFDKVLLPMIRTGGSLTQKKCRFARTDNSTTADSLDKEYGVKNKDRRCYQLLEKGGFNARLVKSSSGLGWRYIEIDKGNICCPRPARMDPQS